ncbi:N-6 DNA methylase [Gracilibacillus phocaeensis]|uniref:class I SAM-dependent DNA methyltransferase n=1 Tax=Gracilibacillus phocaeensis TaxID=2042304 RepID=UPI00102FD306|nr:N-6 DNA methylase [Gracilibacillus phocaeensis]
MNNQEIVQKLWKLCNVLRDDGITYHQYVTELTYILFLKMMHETNQDQKVITNPQHRWNYLMTLDGIALKDHYRMLLVELGKSDNRLISEIYADAKTFIDEPRNLEKIFISIDQLDWYSAKQEGLGDLYEGLLEKNASELKSGAGQYFTPRVLIDRITELVDPQPGERCFDPAAGTFGFMIAADRHVRKQTDDYFELGKEQIDFQLRRAFGGVELVKDTHRLAVMNALLHDIQGEIVLGDTLSTLGETLKNYDVVLTNPPFGTKKGGERVTRTDFTYSTSNKQLNFLQHIYRSLKANDQARAAVVLPDNVLFESGVGADIRRDLMDKCDLHTILRLPTGIFYAQGVKTNVLFFTRGSQDVKNTKGVWVYDMRTNMPSFGKRTPLTNPYFDGFMHAYQAKDRSKVQDERWNWFTREEIAKKEDSLDIGLIADESLAIYENLPDPIKAAEEAAGKLEEALGLLQEVMTELRETGQDNEKADSILEKQEGIQQ